MKNKFIFFLLLTVTLAFFTSCEMNEADFGNPFSSGSDDAKNKTAIEIYEAAEAKMESLDSYTVTAKIALGMTWLGKPLVVETEGVAITQTTDEGKFLYYEKADTSSSYDEKVERDRFVNGFQDEYMYQYYSNGEMNTELCSPISTEDYKEYMKTKDDSAFEIYDFAKQEKKVVDNGWKLIFSDLSSEGGLDYLKDILDFSALELDISVEDVNVTVTVNSDYYLTDMYLEVVFKNNDESDESAEQLPKMIAEERYSGFNCSVVEKINVTNFNIVSDLRCIDKAADAFRELTDSKETNFTLSVPNSTNSAYTEIYDVNYSLSNGKLTYVMMITLKSATGVASEASITYSGGKKIVTSGNMASTQESDDFTEKAFIRYLILPLEFDASRVYEVTTDKDGAVVFKIEATEKQIKQLLGGTPNSKYTGEFVISVVFEGDMIKEYRYEILLRKMSLSGSIVSHTKYTVTDLSYEADK